MSTDTAEPATFRIEGFGLKAEISQRGAELVRLQDEQDRDLLWDGNPAFWTGRAPLLFPIVGRLKDDQFKVDGVTYPMKQHGFARTSTFEMVVLEPALCRMRLSSSEQTRQVYPFDFTLEATYSLKPGQLVVAVSARNTGTTAMPASMGFHPAFRWPLPYGAARADHEIVFEHDEPAPIRRVVGGLLSPEAHPTPVQGRRLPLADALFVDDAVIFLDQQSHAVRFGPPGGRALHVSFPGMPDLGLWSKPGAGFVCIEPWNGHASPQGFDGDLAEKPGIILIPPGATHEFGFSVTLDPA